MVKIIDDFFKIDNNIEPAQGKVLISEPLLDDFFFKRSVVLLIDHNSEGSMGFVINNPFESKITELIPDFPDFDANISVGGPVSTDMIQFIHTLGNMLPDSIEVIPGLYWGGSFELLKTLISLGKVRKNEVLFFLGYSGWSPNQLEEEIDIDSWLISELSVNDIMAYKENIWRTSLNGFGEKEKAWSNFPEDHNLN